MASLPTYPNGGHVSKGNNLLSPSVHTLDSPKDGREGRDHLEDRVKP